jgi:hypothetical protein
VAGLQRAGFANHKHSTGPTLKACSPRVDALHPVIMLTVAITRDGWGFSSSYRLLSSPPSTGRSREAETPTHRSASSSMRAGPVLKRRCNQILRFYSVPLRPFSAGERPRQRGERAVEVEHMMDYELVIQYAQSPALAKA